MAKADGAVGHLLRRAGFGLAPADAQSYRELGFDAALRRLLDELGQPASRPAGFDPYHPGAIQDLWLGRMVSGAAPLAEKLALFLHGHFATSDAKIAEPVLMLRQYELFRAAGAQQWEALVLSVSRDVAMIRWLDGNANRKGSANENYARELQELFTLGIGNYSETDVRETARAFTGWGSRHHEFEFRDEFHDHGRKTVHGVSGDLDGDDVVAILCALPASRRFLAGKLLRFFSHPDPAQSEIAELADVLESTKGDLRAALFAVFNAPAFRAEKNRRALVKSPVEFVVSALRAVGETQAPLWAHASLERMGQILFRPPSVKGWPSGADWLTASAMVERLKATRRLAQERTDSAATIVDIAFDGDLPESLAASLERAQGADRVALALASPEFQLC